MNRTINTCLLAVISALYALPTLADATANVVAPNTLIEAIAMGKPMTSFRLRYENVDQANKSE